MIIDGLRANGYELTSVSDLLGQTRDGVMVPLSFRERLVARADGVIFGIFQWSRFAIATVFILGIVLVSGRALIIGILAIIEKLRPDHAKLADPPPAVTVLIPAYNEESVIVQTVSSVLLSDLNDIQRDCRGRWVGGQDSRAAALQFRPQRCGTDHSSGESREGSGPE